MCFVTIQVATTLKSSHQQGHASSKHSGDECFFVSSSCWLSKTTLGIPQLVAASLQFCSPLHMAIFALCVSVSLCLSLSVSLKGHGSFHSRSTLIHHNLILSRFHFKVLISKEVFIHRWQGLQHLVWGHNSIHNNHVSIMSRIKDEYEKEEKAEMDSGQGVSNVCAIKPKAWHLCVHFM